MGLLNNVLPFSLMAWGQLHIETGLTAILNAATAIWGVLVAALIFPDERLTLRRMFGVLIGFPGVATAIGLANFTKLDLRSLAQLAVISGTVSYAFAGSWARAQLRDVPPLVSAAGMLTGSTLIMLPLAHAIEGPLPVDLTPRTGAPSPITRWRPPPSPICSTIAFWRRQGLEICSSSPDDPTRGDPAGDMGT